MEYSMNGAPGPCLDYDGNGDHNRESAMDEEALKHSSWLDGGHKLNIETLEPLSCAFVSMQNSEGRMTESTPRKIEELRSCLKNALNQVEEVIRRDQKNRAAASRRNSSPQSRRDHYSTPGSIVLAPILEPLGNEDLPVTDRSRVSTPNGPAISKLKPQVIICPMGQSAVTAVIGSRQNRPLTDEDIRRYPNLKKQFLRLISRGHKQRDIANELAAVEVTGGSFLVRDASVLDGAILNVVRYQDIQHGYDGSCVHRKSIPSLIDFLHQNNADKLQVLARAHGLGMDSTANLYGRPTAGAPVNRQLHYSELDADDLLREREEEKRSRESLRGSTHIREMESGEVNSRNSVAYPIEPEGRGVVSEGSAGSRLGGPITNAASVLAKASLGHSTTKRPREADPAEYGTGSMKDHESDGGGGARKKVK